MALARFRRRREDTIGPLYGAIVAQARLPEFYASYGVPDTIEGRFDMIVLHLCLVIRRLRGGSPAQRGVSQRLFDLFCSDMDHNLREMGVSDVSVPKEMRRFGEAFYGRAAAYDRALDATDDVPLVAALHRNIFATGEYVGARRLAAYVRDAARRLGAQEAAAIALGRVQFPPAAAFAITTGSESASGDEA